MIEPKVEIPERNEDWQPFNEVCDLEKLEPTAEWQGVYKEK